jgi:hypothetical protein
MKTRSSIAVAALAAIMPALLVGETISAARAQAPAEEANASGGGWSEIKWPFLLDQWGTGRAFQCGAGNCGTAITLYLRAKLGFCNCSTGVSDDAELDRVGDLELLSDKFEGLGEGRPIAVAWMSGRSRAYRVETADARARSALAIAFNDKCDVVVATVVAEHPEPAERAALSFLNGDLVLRWAEKELGL